MNIDVHGRNEGFKTHPPFNICANPVLTPKVPPPPPDADGTIPLGIRAGVDVPLVVPLPFVGSGLEDGTIVGSDILNRCFMGRYERDLTGRRVEDIAIL